jgi:hypothetical protein
VQSGGEPLAGYDREFFEPAFGRSFDGVRVHTHPAAARAAQAIGARAYTVGNDVAFAPGEYAPGTDGGRRLMAHELAHVAQGRGTRGRVARDPVPGSGAPSGATTAAAASAVIDGDLSVEEAVGFETEHRGELAIQMQNRLRYHRRVRIRTRDGIEATLEYNATVDLPFGADMTRSPMEAIDDLGHAEIGYVLTGTMPDGSPISGLGLMSANGGSLRELAASSPRFLHFGLTPEAQYRNLVEAIRDARPERAPGPAVPGTTAPLPAPSRGPDRAVTEEAFRDMTPAERRAMAERSFWEEFSVSNVLVNVLIGVGIALVALAAIAAAFFGAIELAVGLTALALVAAVVGLAFILWQTISEIIDRISLGQYGEALLALLRGALQIVAVVAGAVALMVAVAALILGAPIEIGALVVIGIVTAVAAAAVALYLAYLDFERAVGARSLREFRESIERSAREAEQALTDTVVLVITVILGGIGRVILGRSRPPVVELPPERRPPAPPVDGEVPPDTTLPPAGESAAPEARPLPEPLRRPPWFRRLPRYLQRTLEQNPPAMDPERTARMSEMIRNYRRRPDTPRRIDPIGEVGEPVQGGTVAVAETDIPTLEGRVFPGASAEALPPGMRGRPGTTGGEVFEPVNPTAVDHAEHVALENVRAAIDRGLADGSLTRADLANRTVYVVVEQEPCPSCAAGVGGGAPGVLEQFSARFPELTIEVRNMRTTRAFIYRGGVLLNP